MSQLSDTIDNLTGELERYRDMHAETRDTIDNLAGKLERYRDMHAETLIAHTNFCNSMAERITQLEAALRKYGHHLAECDYIVNMYPCSCGLEQVRAALAPVAVAGPDIHDCVIDVPR